MKGFSRLPKWKRVLIRVFVIALCSIVAYGGLLLCWMLIDASDLLRYVDDLRGHELSAIEGKPETLDKDGFEARVSDHVERNGAAYSILPPSAPESGESFFYYFETVKHDGVPYGRWELYASCVWDELGYQAEKERLVSMVGQKKPPLWSEDLFVLPSCVYIFEPGLFKYVLFDEPTCQIHYIGLSEISLGNIVFDTKLAPHKRIQDSDVGGEAPFGRFSVYN